MPTLSISAALLVLGNTEGFPWHCDTWLAITNTTGPPWETPADATPNSPAPNVPRWTVATAQSVKSYAQNLWGRSPSARVQYSSRTYTDNDSEGRVAWNTWVQTSIRAWKLNEIVNDVFKDCKLTAYECMGRAKSNTVSTIDVVHCIIHLTTISCLLSRQHKFYHMSVHRLPPRCLARTHSSKTVYS